MSAKSLPAASEEPSTTEPQPRSPAATAPCSASGPAARVMRAACTLGTIPCSAIATSVASRTRRCAAEGSAAVSSSQKCSEKLSVPISSRARSRPRTRIVSAFAALIAELRRSCRPIFTAPPSFRYPNMTSLCETILNWLSAHRQERRPRPSVFSDTEINFAHAAALSVLDGSDTGNVPRASVRTLLRLEAHVGSRFPAHATSTGRVLLAGLSAERLQRYFDTASLEPLTERTVTSATELRSLIAECRRNGYAVVEDELAYGVVALAVPVLDQQRRVVAALNTSSPSPRTTRTPLPRERLGMLQQVSRQISADLATVPWLSLSAQL